MTTRVRHRVRANRARNTLTIEERKRHISYFNGEKYAMDRGLHLAAIERRTAKRRELHASTTPEQRTALREKRRQTWLAGAAYRAQRREAKRAIYKKANEKKHA